MFFFPLDTTYHGKTKHALFLCCVKPLGVSFMRTRPRVPLHLVGPLFPLKFYPTLKETCQILLSVYEGYVIVLGEAQGHMLYQKLSPIGLFLVIHDTQWVCVRYHG